MIIFHNPHSKTFFGQTLMGFVLRNSMSKKSKKYKYLLDFLGKNRIKFGIYLDYQESSLPHFLKKKFFIRIETFLWLMIKNINPFYITIIDDANKINKDDIFFSFSLTTLDTEYHGIDDISDKDFIKIFHFTHFVQNTSLIAKNFKRLKGDFIIAENNLQNSPYFKNFFANYNKDVYMLPFTYGDRYKNLSSFDVRKNKCLSTGAIINISDYKGMFDDFYSFYKSDTLQPLRKEILNKRDEIINYIENANANFAPVVEKNIFLSILKKVILGSKHPYFAFDIVQMYNGYKMFICGEEINNLPGIGFVEGMACGCAYIGKIDTMYTDLGMIPGIHYIGHDGTLNDVITKIKYYQEHPRELEEIAVNGFNFVRENLNGEVVAKKFYNDLLKLSENFKENNYNKDNLIFISSFVQGKKS